MAANTQEFEAQVLRLITGLTDQEIKTGQTFLFEGQRVHADDVAVFVMPTLLLLANDLAKRQGLTGFGMSFYIGEINPVFPIHYTLEDDNKTPSFSSVAPWALEIFDSELMECRHDLAQFYEVGARLLRPEFKLAPRANTPTVVSDANAAPAPQSTTPTLGM